LSSGVAITPPARDVKLFPFLLNEFSLSLSLSFSPIHQLTKWQIPGMSINAMRLSRRLQLQGGNFFDVI
jgi:hypothetical protein